MTRLLSSSIVLFLWGTIVLHVPSGTQALVTVLEIGGNYTFEQGSLKMCRLSAEVKNLGNVLPPNSISFGGMDCLFDGVVLQQEFGIYGLDRTRNSAVGTVVSSKLGSWTCHGSTRRSPLLYFFRPSSQVDIRNPGFSNAFFYQKDVLYFVFLCL